MLRRGASDKAFVATTAAALLILAGTLGPMTAAAADGSSGAIEAYLRSEMAASAIPGLAVEVVRDGRVAYAGAFGTAADGRVMTTRSPIVVGSVGKSITALAVRQLVAAGLVELDAPLRVYLPTFSLATTTEQIDAITVRSLLDHTSGISTADGQDPRWYAPSLSSADVVRSLAAVRPDRPAGTYEYSNLNYVLLGALIEVVSGQSYGGYVADHVFGLLGMRDSSTSVGASGHGAATTGHRYVFGVPIRSDEAFPSAVVPAGYQVSTADDMARFVAALASAGTYEGTDVVSGAPASADPPPLGTDWGSLAAVDTGAAIGQSGSTLTTNADILEVPGRHLGVVVLMNANPTQLMGLPRGAADIALDVLRLSEGAPAASTAPSVMTVYLVVDSVLVALAALLAVHLWRARTWPDRYAGGTHRARLTLRTVVADLILPVTVLLAAPLAIGVTGSSRTGDLLAGWGFLLWTLPDIGVALLVLAGTSLALGAVKLLAARRATAAAAPRSAAV
jgi:CubicO group peptidase (beta-lactamase class C family)